MSAKEKINSILSGDGGTTWFGVDSLQILRLLAGIIIFCFGLFLPVAAQWKTLIMLICFLLCGYDVVLHAVSNVMEAHYLDENLMIFIASAAAFFISAAYEGAAVMLIYQLGSILRAFTTVQTHNSVNDALGFYPTSVVVLQGGEERSTYSEDVVPGDVLVIRPGEMFPVDCVIEEGHAVIDRSLLCGEGESAVTAEEGSTIYAGSINLSGNVTVRACATEAESLPARLQQMADDERSGKGDAAFFIERIAHVYAPFALGVSVLIALIALIFTDGAVSDAIHRALVILIITCPSTFLVSVPLTYFAGLRGMLQAGVLAKGPAVLDDMTRVADVLFDKEGILTTGKYRVISIKSERMDPNVLLKVAAHAQANSTGAVAQSIVHAYEGVIDRAVIDSFTEYENGIVAEIDSIPIVMGTYDFMRDQAVESLCPNDGSLSVYMAVGGQYAGHIVLADTIRSAASSMVLDFDAIGCSSVLLTSDTPDRAKAIADSVGIRQYRAQCMPMDKLAYVQEIKENRPADCVLFIGTGMEEAPALGTADIGVTLNGAVSKNSLDVGDLVIMNGVPEKISQAISMARDTHRIIRQNLLVIGVVKLLLLILALVGVSYQLWFAAFVDMIASVACMLNAYRAFPAQKQEDVF